MRRLHDTLSRNTPCHLTLGLLIVSAVAGPSASANEAAFNNNCRTCHSVKANDNRVGPSLQGVVGRKAGSAPGFNGYSQGMKNSGITWDEATLDKFLENPDAVVQNNAMKPFKGVPDKSVRAGIVQYLKSTGN
jgi:cytochrome c